MDMFARMFPSLWFYEQLRNILLLGIGERQRDLLFAIASMLY